MNIFTNHPDPTPGEYTYDDELAEATRAIGQYGDGPDVEAWVGSALPELANIITRAVVEGIKTHAATPPVPSLSIAETFIVPFVEATPIPLVPRGDGRPRRVVVMIETSAVVALVGDHTDKIQQYPGQKRFEGVALVPNVPFEFHTQEAISVVRRSGQTTGPTTIAYWLDIYGDKVHGR